TLNGLNLFDRKSGTSKRYYPDKSKHAANHGNNITSIIEDKKGNLWIGTWGSGLQLFNQKKETFTKYLHDYKDKSTIGGNSIYDLFIDTKGNFWVGVENGG